MNPTTEVLVNPPKFPIRIWGEITYDGRRRWGRINVTFLGPYGSDTFEKISDNSDLSVRKIIEAAKQAACDLVAEALGMKSDQLEGNALDHEGVISVTPKSGHYLPDFEQVAKLVK
jgi:hypothetical protein